MPSRAHGDQRGSSTHPSQLLPVQENIWGTAPGWLHHFSWESSCFLPSFSWHNTQEQSWHLLRKQNPVGLCNSSPSTCKWLMFIMGTLMTLILCDSVSSFLLMSVGFHLGGDPALLWHWQEWPCPLTEPLEPSAPTLLEISRGLELRQKDLVCLFRFKMHLTVEKNKLNPRKLN